MSYMEIPLFPLSTVLTPGGPLLLRIFEPRYLEMVGKCLSSDSGFGVSLIQEGSETATDKVHAIGTFAKIADWYQYDDGLLGITAIGLQRFRLVDTSVKNNGLLVGQVTLLNREPAVPVPAQYRHLAEIVERILGETGSHYELIERDFANASWVGYRLMEFLPLTNEQKQFGLEICDPIERLELLVGVVEKMDDRA
ncbi:MAG: LON peptidase substrate-binding domain-containing protein [Pseudomonadota bacterium]